VRFGSKGGDCLSVSAQDPPFPRLRRDKTSGVEKREAREPKS
jgi:hypothetical protein